MIPEKKGKINKLYEPFNYPNCLPRDIFQTIAQEWEIQAEYISFAEVRGQRLDMGEAEAAGFCGREYWG